jgi:hypothetical protein
VADLASEEGGLEAGGVALAGVEVKGAGDGWPGGCCCLRFCRRSASWPLVQEERAEGDRG